MIDLTPVQLAQLHAAVFKASRAWSEEEMRSLLSSPHVLVAGTEHGFAMGRVIGDEAELLTIVVHPDQQGRGIGRTLLTSFEDEAKSRGARLAYLEVAADNEPARAMYITSGWSESGRRTGYYTRQTGSPVDAILLAKHLPLREPSEK
ncbi:GNAT family N-acetyltransferase [Aliiroseovarius sp. Z3]|uniref:GNAT family N-acetyltransferase n=1 Tax=Aliiroseovarius sp. Z3 TaxID=2811402 RepID=UPI0023B321F9|nr:GNAT family N-acetyltransferase [Aliiroseovarius sp. Z3]MDE9451065.1 GNAT family N-acetyltransferase [Aliiroseovarius sp. Z3]